jgi:acetolactate synthase-1/2/3 large subunit
MKYSDAIANWLISEGYTHCFFVAGGNIMHLLNSVREKFVCVPFVHEFGAAAAAEYFTAISGSDKNKAFVLVTAGPGLTNTITAIASAWTESRELLVIGGQVKSTDMSRGELRQRGIQEIDGIKLAESICKATLQIDAPVSRATFVNPIRLGSADRKGPVFIEVCLDAQGATVGAEALDTEEPVNKIPVLDLENQNAEQALEAVKKARRPVLLIGGGCNYEDAKKLESKLSRLGIPVMTTWNGSDRFSSEDKQYFGRPNTWGQRYSNIILQQSDLLIAIGTRLGIQQTGFAWDEFMPVGEIIQVDIDKAELDKNHPVVKYPLQMDANLFLERIADLDLNGETLSEWLNFCFEVKNSLPIVDPLNTTGDQYIDPFSLLSKISNLVSDDSSIIPCSSGGSFTVAMQTYSLRGTQRMLSNKGMASMGYGLSGAIGAALAKPKVQTYLFEGDGGFAQNLQELGTVAANNLSLKIFVFANRGYASIRMTQKNYFNGAWVGCDAETGLGLPDWKKTAESFGIPYIKMTKEFIDSSDFVDALISTGPKFFEVPTDPEQTYFPKISSKVLADGTMRSNPLHLMDPALDVELSNKLFRYLD